MSIRPKSLMFVGLLLILWLGSCLYYAMYQGQTWYVQVFQGALNFCWFERPLTTAAGWSFDYDLPFCWAGFRPTVQSGSSFILRLPLIWPFLAVVGLGLAIRLGRQWRRKQLKEKAMSGKAIEVAAVLALGAVLVGGGAWLFHHDGSTAQAADSPNYEGVPLAFRVVAITPAGVDPVDGLPLTDFVIRSGRFALTRTHNRNLMKDVGFEGQVGTYECPADPVTRIGRVAWVAVSVDETGRLSTVTIFPKGNLPVGLTPLAPEFALAVNDFKNTHDGVEIITQDEYPHRLSDAGLEPISKDFGYQEYPPPKLTGEDLCDPCAVSHPYVLEYRARIKGDLSEFRLNGEPVVVGTETAAYLYRVPEQGD